MREDLGKTQKEMASLLGVNYRTYQNYENGVNNPGWEVFESITKQGFNPTWLITGEGPIKQSVAGVNQTATNSSGIQIGSTSRSSVIQGGNKVAYSSDVQEICELLELYTTQFYRKKLKAELIRIKEQEEGR